MVSHAGIRIGAVGAYVPERRLSNVERLSVFGLGEEFLRTKLGIAARAVKADHEETSDLCVKAFGALRARQSVALADVRVCCVVTQNPDANIPHTAAIVHQKLGLARSCMTFDLSQGCAGYVHGLALVTSLMGSLGLDQALLFTCDPYSKIVDPNDKNTALIFGDAATVTCLVRDTTGYSLVDADFGTQPGSSACLSVDGGAAFGTRPTLKMDGTAVLFHAAHTVPASIRALLDKNGRSLDDVDLFLLHPGSRRVVDVIKKDLKLQDAKVPFYIDQYGNTVSSSIPLMLAPHLDERRHARLVLSGFGVGFSWGTCLVELRH